MELVNRLEKLIKDYRFKVIFSIYLLLLVIVWGGSQLYWCELKSFFDGRYGDGFFQSTMASFLQDFIFFGIIGFASLFVTLARPEDEAFYSRIRALANSNNATESARTYLQMQTKEALAFNSKSKVKLVIREYDKKHNALKISTEIVNNVVNMCKDIEHTMVNTEAKVITEKEINGLSGEVNHLTMTDSITGHREDPIEAYGIHLKQGENFNEPIDNFKISPGGTGIWKFCYWIWTIIEPKKENHLWYFVKFSRFTDKLFLSIENKTDNEICFDFKYKDRPVKRQSTEELPEISKSSIILEPKGTFEICNGASLYDNDFVKLFFNYVK